MGYTLPNCYVKVQKRQVMEKMDSTFKATARRPKYMAIAEAIKAEIVSGRIGQNERISSCSELRARYGVTPTTINQVYGLLEREGLVVREHGRGVFVQGSLRGGTGTIAVPGGEFTRSQRSPYWDDLFRGIETAASDAGFEILITKLGSNSLRRGKVDGIILAGYDESAMSAMSAGMPCVSLLVPLEGVTSVAIDDYRAMRSVVDYLIELGHRKIAFLYEGTIGPLTRPRHHAVSDGMEEAGIAIDPRWARAVPLPLPAPSDFRAGARETMTAWLHDDWKELGCTAIVAINDETAIGAMQALEEAGVRVPEEVSVVGFDGIETRDNSLPSLTTVEIPLRQMGATGMEILLRQIRGETGAAEAARTLLSTRLRIGESTGPPRHVGGTPANGDLMETVANQVDRSRRR